MQILCTKYKKWETLWENPRKAREIKSDYSYSYWLCCNLTTRYTNPDYVLICMLYVLLAVRRRKTAYSKCIYDTYQRNANGGWNLPTRTFRKRSKEIRQKPSTQVWQHTYSQYVPEKIKDGTSCQGRLSENNRHKPGKNQPCKNRVKKQHENLPNKKMKQRESPVGITAGTRTRNTREFESTARTRDEYWQRVCTHEYPGRF